jgi:hypothetical protein
MRWIAAILGAAFIALFATPVGAQTVCGERAKFIEMLGTKYLEQPVSMGLTSTGAVIEVFTSPKGSWSILLTYPTGSTCMVAAGDKWEALPLPVAGELS